MDISETGVQIGEKLALLLNEKQQKELAQYLLEDIVSIVDAGANSAKHNWQQFDILFLLASNPKRVFTYALIMDFVWNEGYTYYSRKAITNHVSNLRKKLKIRPDDPDYIKNVAGIGYKFE